MKKKTWPRPSPALIAWLVMVALSFASVLASHEAHAGLGTGAGRMAMVFAVAGIAWAKGLLLIRHYLEAHRAGPLFHRIMLGFAALAPLALLVSGWREL